jgi:hypothetical protein
MLLSTIPFLQQIASAQGTCASIQSRAHLAMTCTPGRSYPRAASKATAATTNLPRRQLCQPGHTIEGDVIARQSRNKSQKKHKLGSASPWQSCAFTTMLLSTIPYLQQIASAHGTCATQPLRAHLAMTVHPIALIPASRFEGKRSKNQNQKRLPNAQYRTIHF